MNILWRQKAAKKVFYIQHSPLSRSLAVRLLSFLIYFLSSSWLANEKSSRRVSEREREGENINGTSERERAIICFGMNVYTFMLNEHLPFTPCRSVVMWWNVEVEGGTRFGISVGIHIDAIFLETSLTWLTSPSLPPPPSAVFLSLCESCTHITKQTASIKAI